MVMLLRSIVNLVLFWLVKILLVLISTLQLFVFVVLWAVSLLLLSVLMQLALFLL
jgi:hypothetical protein